MSNTAIEDRFWSKVDKSGDCWLWTAAKTFEGGYGQLGIGGKLVLTHRLVYEMTYGPIPASLMVLHRCDNPSCVRPEHLFLGTAKDNARDMALKGRTWQQQHPERVKRGGKHGNAKFTDDQVLTIREAFASGVGMEELARQWGVTPTTIARMISGEGWTHLPNVGAERYRTMDRPRAPKLTADLVREIRSLADRGMKQRVIAEQFGLNVRTVNGIVRRENWKDV